MSLGSSASNFRRSTAGGAAEDIRQWRVKKRHTLLGASRMPGLTSWRFCMTSMIDATVAFGISFRSCTRLAEVSESMLRDLPLSFLSPG